MIYIYILVDFLNASPKTKFANPEKGWEIGIFTLQRVQAMLIT